MGEADGASWIDAEVAGCALGDKRLGDRLRRLLHQMEGAMGAPLPLACQDWANTKAAYRFFSSQRFGEEAILAGHFRATASRVAATPGLVLVIQDTTTFSFPWAKPETIGLIGRATIGWDRNGNPRTHTQCGLLMHSSFVVTLEGLPLGLAAVQFWSRKEFHDARELKRHVNPTRVPIDEKESIRWLSSMEQSRALLGDPGRCVYFGDRENDIYEFFCAAREAGTHFLVRTCVDRLADDGRRTVARIMARVSVAGQHRIEVTAEDGTVSEAALSLRYKRVHILPPVAKQKRYPALDLTVIHARKARKLRGRERIEWRLVTDLAINSPEDAVEKLQWYAQRWKIELFHKILTSGCHVEAARLRTAERLNKLIAMFCILSWRSFWTTMVYRIAPDAPPQSALTDAEMTVIDRAVRDRPTIPAEKSLSHYLLKIACLGGYLTRAHDRPPGNTVMRRGWARLMDIMLGAELMQQKCG
ncbi:IS4 family transposase [Dankookia sp. GCM10030260]|uniref:IS4 family transposase n=1 Tax=Dankookia sp. GCM10030260 TaxID=3273390 RepID=UPI00361A98A6